MTSRFLAVRGNLQRAGLVVHVVAESFVDLSDALRHLSESGAAGEAQETLPAGADLPLLKSRDFH